MTTGLLHLGVNPIIVGMGFLAYLGRGIRAAYTCGDRPRAGRLVRRLAAVVALEFALAWFRKGAPLAADVAMVAGGFAICWGTLGDVTRGPW